MKVYQNISNNTLTLHWRTEKEVVCNETAFPESKHVPLQISGECHHKDEMKSVRERDRGGREVEGGRERKGKGEKEGKRERGREVEEGRERGRFSKGTKSWGMRKDMLTHINNDKYFFPCSIWLL